MDRFRLAYQPPYDWDALLAFLSARATPGVENADKSGYERTISLDGKHGAIHVCHADKGNALDLEVRFANPHALPFIVERVKRIFDLGADPSAIASQLRRDPLLRVALRKHAGIRAPGAWDGFELAVRAIIGQQISVKGATTIAGRIASMFGSPSLFPTSAQLLDAPIEEAGLISARAGAIRALAKRVEDGRIVFGATGDHQSTVAALKAIPGIGEWTAQYIAMRALGEADAFPSGDVVLRRLTAGLSARELDRRAEAWRPWRSYAVMLLWQSATDERDTARTHGLGSESNTSRAH